MHDNKTLFRWFCISRQSTTPENAKTLGYRVSISIIIIWVVLTLFIRDSFIFTVYSVVALLVALYFYFRSIITSYYYSVR